MKRKEEPQTPRPQVANLKALDALVGRYLTRETPQVFWEEQQACLRFDSIEEALEAMHDPYYQEFIPREARPHSALTEVQEFRPYSTDLILAWALVEQLSNEAAAFHVRRESGRWVASFGEAPAVRACSAPVAICLAALWACGIEAEFLADHPVDVPQDRAFA